MRECAFAKEPVDYKLIALRMVQKLWAIIVSMVVGALVFGGGYFMIREVIGERTYQAESIYYITFAKDEAGQEYDYYNHYTWGTAIGEDALVAEIAKQSGENEEAVRASVSATIESDVRYLYTRVVTTSPEKSLKIAKAVEQSITAWATTKPEFASVVVSQAATKALDNSKIRTLSALVVGALLGLFFGVFGLLLSLLSEDAVYLPASLEKRYGIVTLTAPSMPEFRENMQTLLGEKKQIVCLSGAFGDVDKDRNRLGDREITVVANPCVDPCDIERMKTADAVIVSVPYGKKCGRQVERTLEQLSRSNLEVTAMVLVDEDEKLLKTYYR